MRLRERLRRQLLSETGVDFDRFRPAATRVFRDEPDLGGRLLRDLLVAMVTGLGLASLLVLATALLGLSGVAAFFAVLGSVGAGLGTAVLIAAVRLRRRIPEEVDSVFRVAGEIAADASSQLEGLSASVEQIVRGVVTISAIPVVTAAVSKRFLVLAPVVRTLLDGVLTRIVTRGFPAVTAAMPDASPRVRQIAAGVAVSRDRVIGRASALTRWGTLPLAVAGAAIAGTGLFVSAVSWAIGLASREIGLR